MRALFCYRTTVNMLTQHCQQPRISLFSRLGEAHEIFTDCQRISFRSDDHRWRLDRMVVRWLEGGLRGAGTYGDISGKHLA